MRILTNEQIRFIFRTCHALNGEKCDRKSLADKYNISESMVSNIAHGKSWKEEIKKLVVEVKDEETRKKINYNIECERNYKRETEMKRKRGVVSFNVQSEENDLDCVDEGESENRMKTWTGNSRELRLKERCKQIEWTQEKKNKELDEKRDSGEKRKKEMANIMAEMKEYYNRSKEEGILCWKGLDQMFEESQKKVTNEEIELFFS
jgi:hypothetical protein